MKRTTLWALCATTLLCATQAQAQTTTYAQFSATPASQVSDDGTGQIGIGTVTPDAKLHVFGNCDNNALIRVSNTACTPYYFIGQTNAITPGSPPTFSTETRFVVTNNGHIGIGDADPAGPIHIKLRPVDYFTGSPPSTPYGDRKIIAIEDADDEDIFTVANTGNGTTHGAGVIIKSSTDFPALAVHNGFGNSYLAVFGDGSVSMGLNTSALPVAQLDLRTVNGQDYLLNVANSNNTLPYFNIHESGNIGIGLIASSSTAKLGVRGNIDLYYNSTTAPALRITNSGGTARHVITDADDNLLIDAGVGGGANDNLVLNGIVAVKRNGISDVKLDLVENNNSGWNAQLRIIGTTGMAKHIITEVDNELYIDPGFDGNATDNVRIAGNIITTGDATINNNLLTEGNAVFDNSVVVAGRLQVGPLAPTGSYNGYRLGVDGDIVAKKVIVQTGSWADKVFEQEYNLRSLADIEKYIAQHGHLPEIPSECEVLQNGIEVGEMNKLLLQKVEELTLHMIAQQKLIEELRLKLNK